MADAEQLNILRSGVHLWNEWRKDNYDEEVDLSEADLRDMHLVGADFIGVCLGSACLSNANLSNADLSSSILTEADLRGAILCNADLAYAFLGGANLTNADVTGANLTGADITGATLEGVDLSKAKLPQVREHVALLREGASVWNAWRAANIGIMPNLACSNFYRADVSGANLSHIDLTRSSFGRADMSCCNLRGANLHYERHIDADAEEIVETELDEDMLAWLDAEDCAIDEECGDFCWANLSWDSLREANLNGADLSGANLSGQCLVSANLRESLLVRADVTGCNMILADLTEADLTDADLSGSWLYMATLTGTKMSGTNMADVVVTDADLDTRINEIAADIVDRNWLYEDLIDVLYRQRKNNPAVLAATERTCLKQISIANRVAVALKERSPSEPLPEHRGFFQLGVIYERQGRLADACGVFEMASSQGWNSGDTRWESRIERCQKRIRRNA